MIAGHTKTVLRATLKLIQTRRRIVVVMIIVPAIEIARAGVRVRAELTN